MLTAFLVASPGHQRVIHLATPGQFKLTVDTKPRIEVITIGLIMIAKVRGMSLIIRSATKHSRSKFIAGFCVSAVVLTACQSPTESGPERTVTTEYRAFTNSPHNNDIPDVELDEPVLEDIEDHYFRYLGLRDATKFYMARTDHEDTVTQGLCFIAVDTETNDATSTCRGPEDLDPMVIHLETPVEAFLIPDDTHVEELPEGWSQARRNVVVVTEPDTAPDEAEVLLPSSGMPTEYTLQRN